MPNDKLSSYYLEEETPSKTQAVLKKTTSVAYNLVQFGVFLGIIGIFLYLFVFPFNIVDGFSMSPNFCSNDIYITYKLEGYFVPYKREDVIAFKLNETTNYIKRVVGVPGDTIMISDGKVYRNNELLDEIYIPEGRQTYLYNDAFMSDGQEVVVPKGTYFVMGDNRGNSTDSRVIGFIDPAKNPINGKTVAIVWPPQRIRIFDNKSVRPENGCENEKRFGE